MHVLHLLEATSGGTRRHLRDLALGLLQNKIKLTIVASTLRDPDFIKDIRLFKQSGIDVVTLKIRRNLAPISDFYAICRLIHICRILKPDVLHAHSSKAGMIGRLAAFIAGVPVVYTPHAFAWEGHEHGLLRFLFRLAEKFLTPLTSALIAVSDHERQLARELRIPDERIYQIYNGVDVTISNKALTLKKKELGKDRNLTVGFAGRLCRQKGPDIFLKSIPLILKNIPGCKFIMVASAGNMAEKLRRFVARQPWRESLSWYTANNELETMAAMGKIDILTMPSRWEGLPYTLLEAMQAKVPVIASNVGGIPEVIEHDLTGILLKKNSYEELARAVGSLADGREKSKQIKEAAFKRVVDFSLTNMVEETFLVYQAVCREKSDREIST